MSPADEAVLECPLCGLPHRASARTCDACDHDLRAQPSFPELRSELRERRKNMILAALAIAAMLALNVAVFGGAGYVVLLAPFVWLGSNWLRWRALRAHLSLRGKLEGPERPSA